jgi:hypothetical protein
MRPFHHAGSLAADDVRIATHADILRLVAIRASVRENRLSGPSRAGWIARGRRPNGESAFEKKLADRSAGAVSSSVRAP